MMLTLKRSLKLTLVLTILCCGAYPLTIHFIARIFFDKSANGNILMNPDGTPQGSLLIGQDFKKPEYFHGRPSSAGSGYDASNSSGSNLGPTSQKLHDGVEANVNTVLKENPSLTRGEIPVDMITSSGSGLDPHISPENAKAQADRISKARNISSETIAKLIDELTEQPTFGLLGNARVNVLRINRALNQKFQINATQ